MTLQFGPGRAIPAKIHHFLMARHVADNSSDRLSMRFSFLAWYLSMAQASHHERDHGGTLELTLLTPIMNSANIDSYEHIDDTDHYCCLRADVHPIVQEDTM